MVGIVEAHAEQSGLLPDPDPERVGARRGEVLGEHSRRAFRPGQPREHLRRFRSELGGAWAGLGVHEACARAVYGQVPDLLPSQVEHFGQPGAGQRQQPGHGDRPQVIGSVLVARPPVGIEQVGRSS